MTDRARVIPVSRRTRVAYAGYTMLELLLIVVVMGILATAAIPVMNQSVQARQGAARDEVVRFFEFARGRASAVGVPVGVTVNTVDSSLRIVGVSDAGGGADIFDPVDGKPMFSDLSNAYAGVTVESFVNGDGLSGGGTVWFDFRAEPHTRDEDTGVFDAVFTQNATLTLSSGAQIIVHAYSGLVEER